MLGNPEHSSPAPPCFRGENQIDLFLPINLKTLHQLTRKVKEIFCFEQGEAIDLNKLRDQPAFANLFPCIKPRRAN